MLKINDVIQQIECNKNLNISQCSIYEEVDHNALEELKRLGYFVLQEYAGSRLVTIIKY